MSTCVTLRRFVGVLYLCRRVLVAFHSVERILCSVKGELGRVVTTMRKKTARQFLSVEVIGIEMSDSQEPLAHVHNRLNWRSCGGFVDD